MRLQDILHDFIVTELGPEAAVGPDDNLLTDGVIDSMGVVRLLAFIDERFGYAVPVEDVTVDHLGTIRALATFLESRVDLSD